MADGEGEGLEHLEWLSDCIMGLLKSPSWMSPIASFIDERCIIFDSEEENKFEYTAVHNEFRQVVDDLLTAHLMELSVTREQFEFFCQHGLTNNARLHRVLVHQLVSVEDFLTFKAMMVKRNEALFREALSQLEHNGGNVEEDPELRHFHRGDDALAAAAASCVEEAGRRAIHSASAEGACEEVGGPVEDDDWGLYDENLYYGVDDQMDLEKQQLEEALRMSAEIEQNEAQRAAEEADMAEAIAQSIKAEEERQRVVDTAAADAAAEATGAPIPETVAPPRTLPPLVAAPGAPLRAALPRTVRLAPVGHLPAAAPVEEASAPPPPPPPPVPTVTPAAAMAAAAAAVAAGAAGRDQPTEAEIKSRAEHLRRQREILVAKRNKERERQLGEYVAAKQRSGADGAMGGPSRANPSGEQTGKRLAAELAGGTAPSADPLPDEVKAQAAVHMRQALTAQLKQSLTKDGGGAPN